MFKYIEENFDNIRGIHEVAKKDTFSGIYKKYTKIEVFSLIDRKYLQNLLTSIQENNFTTAKLKGNELPFTRQISIYKKQNSDFDQISCTPIKYNSKPYLLKIYGFKDHFRFKQAGSHLFTNQDGEIKSYNGEDFIKIEISVMANRTKKQIINPKKEVIKNIPRIFDKIFKGKEIKFLNIDGHKANYRTTSNFLKELERNNISRKGFLEKKESKTNTKKIKILEEIRELTIKTLRASFFLCKILNKNIYNTVFDNKTGNRKLYTEGFRKNSLCRLKAHILLKLHYIFFVFKPPLT